MMANIVVFAGCIALVLGAVFGLIAAIGVVRLPDLYTRMHAASKAGAVGSGLILLAVAFICLDTATAVRAVVGVVFLLLTTPVAAHLLARSSYRITDQTHQNLMSSQLKSQRREISRGSTRH